MSDCERIWSGKIGRLPSDIHESGNVQAALAFIDKYFYDDEPDSVDLPDMANYLAEWESNPANFANPNSVLSEEAVAEILRGTRAALITAAEEEEGEG